MCRVTAGWGGVAGARVGDVPGSRFEFARIDFAFSDWLTIWLCHPSTDC